MFHISRNILDLSKGAHEQCIVGFDVYSEFSGLYFLFWRTNSLFKMKTLADFFYEMITMCYANSNLTLTYVDKKNVLISEEYGQQYKHS